MHLYHLLIALLGLCLWSVTFVGFLFGHASSTMLAKYHKARWLVVSFTGFIFLVMRLYHFQAALLGLNPCLEAFIDFISGHTSLSASCIAFQITPLISSFHRYDLHRAYHSILNHRAHLALVLACYMCFIEFNSAWSAPHLIHSQFLSRFNFLSKLKLSSSVLGAS